MLCTIAYEPVRESVAPPAVADDSLWPAAYVSAG
jgi:hypothetical protein